MSDLGHRAPDITGHPDLAEMRERYAKLDARREAVAIDGLVLLTGIYAAISPWVVHFRASNIDLSVNNLIIGLVLAAFGLGLTTAGDRMYRLTWTCAVIGVWMIISPWGVTLGHHPTAGMIWNNVLIGAVACLLGFGAVGLVMGGRGMRMRR
ncbi:SPW repeat protein [Streptacidiphilus fuscans]|uniref:SPW repeat protein n=1 Tax=Streptacidiphilus fuscans TaxID=2789292 RepID=A0A931B1Q6_9ACTN|nr:SPW repeat protein [Streptacidiphilus fuscans]MBF9069580.1 SPW repeat protein [Streptacidiphilus fuscans]